MPIRGTSRRLIRAGFRRGSWTRAAILGPPSVSVSKESTLPPQDEALPRTRRSTERTEATAPGLWR